MNINYAHRQDYSPLGNPNAGGIGNKVKAAMAGGLTACVLALSGCADDAAVASRNLSKAADNFEVPRRIVFFNGITDNIIMTVEGYCSIRSDNTDNQLEITCETEDGVKKEYFGKSDNTAYFVQQLNPIQVSANHYRVTFKPQSILPDVDIRGGTDDLPRTQR